MDWRDFATVLCALLVILGAAALVVSAQSFAIVKGRVVGKGVAQLDDGGQTLQTYTLSVQIENDDRVFRIKRGSIVTYSVSDLDAQRVRVGSHVELFVSSYRSTAEVLSPSGPAV